MKKTVMRLLSLVLLVSMCLGQVSVPIAARAEGKTDNRNYTDGRVSAVEGNLVVEGGSEVIYHSRQEFYGDYTVEMRAAVDHQAAGLMLASTSYSQPALWLLAAVEPFGVWMDSINVWGPPHTQKWPSQQMQLGEYMNLKIEIIDGDVSTYLNGEWLDTIQDCPPEYVSGTLGLRFTTTEAGRVDYVRVSRDGQVIWQDDFDFLDTAKWNYPLEQEYNPDNMEPVWEGDTVYNESVWPIANQEGSIDDIPLLYHADEIVSVQNSRQSREYIEGQDYLLVDGKLRIPSGSAIAGTSYSTYYESWSDFLSTDGRRLYFPGEGSAVTDQQICVTYKHQDSWEMEKPEGKSGFLPATAEKLNAGSNLNIVYYGDSITEGYNASGYVNVPPYMPSWSGLVTAALRNAYPDAAISEVNTAVAGKDAAWGLEQIQDRVIAHDPDLVVLAYGMNDGSAKRPVKDYIGNLKAMMAAVKAANPDCEFVLVSTTVANPMSDGFVGNQEDYAPYVLELQDKGVAVADMTAMHLNLLSRKDYPHMTGNNINHPNDFLQRVYAQVVYQTMTGAGEAEEGKHYTDGRVTAEYGKLVVTGGNEVIYHTREAFSGDYTVEMRAAVDHQAVSLMFGANRSGQPSMWTYAAVDPFGLWIHPAGNWNGVVKRSSDHIKLGEYAKIRVEISGTTVTTYLEDQLIDTIHNVDPEQFSGNLGLRLTTNEAGRVDYVRVIQDDQVIWEDNFDYLDPVKWTYNIDTSATYRDVSYVEGSQDPYQTMDIQLPGSGSGPYPVVVFIHGGAWVIGDKTDSESRNALNTALSNGYAVANVNYRLAQNAQWPAQIYDCKASVRYLRANAEQYNLDPDRIIALGASAGGHLVQMMGTTNGLSEMEDLSMGNAEYSSDVQGVVSYYGISDLTEWNDDTPVLRGLTPLNKAPTAILLGDNYSEEDALAASPISYVNENTVPMLLLHGRDDQLVEFKHSEMMAEKLTESIDGELVETYFTNDGGHGDPGIWDTAEKVKITANFLQKRFNPEQNLDAVENTRPSSWYEELSSYPNSYLNLQYADQSATQKMHLVLPENSEDEPVPVIVFVHGGGFAGGNSVGTSVLYTARGALQALERGYAVAMPDYYCSDNGSYPQPVYDIKAAIRYLRANAETYNLDTERFAIWGESAGGHIADFVALTNNNADYEDLSMGNEDYSSEVQAAVSFYAITDMTTTGNALYRKALLGDNREDAALIRESSPLYQVTENAVPMYLQHGMADNEVAYQDSVALYEKLMEYTGDERNRLELFPGITHAVQKFFMPGNVSKIITWLDTTMTGGTQAREYTVEYRAGAGGTIKGSTSQTVLSGAGTTQVTAVPDNGYEFTGWSDGRREAVRSEENVTADMVLTASFKKVSVPAQYTVTYKAAAGGTIRGTAVQKVTAGKDTVKVTAVPDSGYEFEKWSDGNRNAARSEKKVSKNLILTATFKKIEEKTLKAVSGMKASGQKTTSVKLSWKAVSGAEGYEIETYDSKTKKWKSAGTTGKTSYTVKKLKAATKYSYRVRAYAKWNGKTIKGYYSTVIKTASAPVKPNLKTKKKGSDQVTLSWKRIKRASGYEIQMKKESGKYKRIKTLTKGTKVSFTRKKLKKGTYRFRVRSYVKVGSKKVYGSYSKVKKITIAK